jgi:hypothetical protein
LTDNADGHQCKRLSQNLLRAKNVVEQPELIKAPAFCIWCTGLLATNHKKVAETLLLPKK